MVGNQGGVKELFILYSTSSLAPRAMFCPVFISLPAVKS